MYCNRGPRPAFRHDGHVIADDMCLLISVQIWFKVAVVAAGYLPEHSALHISSQRWVFDDQVRYRVLSLPAYIFQVPFGVAGLVLRGEHFRRVPPCHILALLACQGRRRKHIFFQPINCDLTLRVSIQVEFSSKVHLCAGAVDGNIPADQIALRGPVHMGADFCPIIRKQTYHLQHCLKKVKPAVIISVSAKCCG